MHIELRGDHAFTKMLFEMRGRKPEGWIQATSTWHCEWTTGAPHRLRSVRVTDYREAKPGHDGRIEFADAAPAVLAGTGSYPRQLAQSFDYWRARSDKSLVADLLGAQGVVVADVNGDDLDDLYVLQPGGLPNRLFIRQADGTARDISAEAGVDILDFCRSALLVDLDNDGDQDLALALAWKLVLMEN
nr:VCBS repeat-containing protein [Akkermansiaceae bacterium]